ncbi:MAG: glycine cleavage system aminomethyltransferase GcvT [Chlorobi bacterium]|nr:MAG: glycine cleavage system aminomethyltransferase GcvT [Bacteroidota bacterium]KXK34066.1 MAG: aminomethyltransferase [Chlorobi bacterium OLB6]MBE2265132.1 glycine cleavage system aminomethyltransferase GcvT [Flavobacteriales bacterium]MBL1161351.1 glycine cleavage system aminomethyltransferase GcvT [Chlorobiota bacterium]MBW7852638.1 glycine cleavage system aminomethyltransferase GcvT [Candidatus Kapabacteria bacterium]MCC6331102.1 glycine cleavage system aminomethyltransferase GcvT [Ign
MKQTRFHALHVEANAKMVEFAGFHMPIQYPTGILEEHRKVRTGVGMFDVSHMGEFFIGGPDALALVQKLTTNDASKLEPGKIQYSAMCRHNGGIIDDLLVYCLKPDLFMLVVNGANIDKDYSWVTENAAAFANASVTNESDDYSLLAVQGPKSVDALQPLTTTVLSDLAYYTFTHGTLAGVPMIISRTGYTGEIGFELYFKGDDTVCKNVVDAIMREGAPFGLDWIGLGARDTLRLEKGFCLYGNDITEDTLPHEAGLGWITKLKKGDFNGRDAITAVKDAGITRKLVGFVMKTEKLLPRKDYPILVGDAVVGAVTSGGKSVMLNTGIGLGYVAAEFSEPGTQISIQARGTTFPAEVTKIPFV